MSWFLALLAAVALERLAELVVARRNERWSRARGAIETGRGHYPVMVVLHTALLVGAALEAGLLHRPFLPALGWTAFVVVVAAQVLRWGEHARALAPAELAEEVAERIELLAARLASQDLA